MTFSAPPQLSYSTFWHLCHSIMFCIIKYVDYEQFQNEELQEELLLTSPESENRRLLINPDCPIGILRDYISLNLRLSGELAENFELSTEKAELLNTKHCSPMTNGLELLQNKLTYYVVLQDKEEPSKLIVPLLNRFSKEHLEFTAQQRRKSSFTKVRRRSSSKGSVLSTSVGSISMEPQR